MSVLKGRFDIKICQYPSLLLHAHSIRAIFRQNCCLNWSEGQNGAPVTALRKWASACIELKLPLQLEGNVKHWKCTVSCWKGLKSHIKSSVSYNQIENEETKEFIFKRYSEVYMILLSFHPVGKFYKACISTWTCSAPFAEVEAESRLSPAAFISWTGGGLTTVIGMTASSDRRAFISLCSWHKAHQCMQQCTMQGSHGEFCMDAEISSKLKTKQQSSSWWNKELILESKIKRLFSGKTIIDFAARKNVRRAPLSGPNQGLTAKVIRQYNRGVETRIHPLFQFRQDQHSFQLPEKMWEAPSPPNPH